MSISHSARCSVEVAVVVVCLTFMSAQLDGVVAAAEPLAFDVQPQSGELTGTHQSLQIVLTARAANGETDDLTRTAEYSATPAGVVRVSGDGRVSPVGNGTAEVQIRSGGAIRTVTIKVAGQAAPEPVSFQFHTMPILAKAGCSGGACHGSPNGKGGFKLSLFGFEPEMDRQTLLREFSRRRINVFEPENSLLLRKPAMQIPHAGGQRLRPGDSSYELLRDWIGQGCPIADDGVQCVGIDVFPRESRVLRLPVADQQFRVVARFSDGTTRDVTQLAQYSLSDVNVADVTSTGLVSGHSRGEAAVIIRYLGFIETPLLTFVADVEGFEWNDPVAHNYVDEKVDQKLKQLQYLPSELSSDETFVRRVFLDVIGLLPTPEETRQFVADSASDKRARLIDDLLERSEFDRFQAQKWGDLLRLSRRQIGLTSVFKYNRWLTGAVAENMPYDKFVRELLTSSGNTLSNPAGNYFRTAGDTLDAMETTAQLFLGIRMQCAKCHNHPAERWTQNDYFGLAALFHRVERRKGDDPEDVTIWATSTGDVQHPRDGRVMLPWVPGSENLDVTMAEDRRSVFADWLTTDDNPFFARVEVNRIWAQLVGRGIVEPFDDFRDSNPPSNAPLLEALARDFVAHDFDRRHIFRTILNSRTYQSSSQTTEFNKGDTRFFSHYMPRRLTAEQLLDALGDVTGHREHFALVAPETRATWLPAPDLAPHDRSKLGDVEFLKTFGQPERQSVCECDRTEESSLGQALEMLNGGLLHRMLEHPDNRPHRAVREGASPTAIVADLYQRALSRQPTTSELKASLGYIAAHESLDLALEDICWAIVNKDEFLFQH
jgi:hypothetical protein